MLNIIIFGAPGSGKGTQSQMLVEKYGLIHISTGELLRAEIQKNTPLGVIAKGYIDKGQLIPDNLMLDTLAAHYDSLDKATTPGVIFDGFPRTLPQAEAFKQMLAERGQSVGVMIEIVVPEVELINRLIKRGLETGRSDDNEETIQKRLGVYHTETAPLIDYYKEEGLYQVVLDKGVMAGVFAEISAIIEQQLNGQR